MRKRKSILHVRWPKCGVLAYEPCDGEFPDQRRPGSSPVAQAALIVKHYIEQCLIDSDTAVVSNEMENQI
jgi:hypothetical protein